MSCANSRSAGRIVLCRIAALIGCVALFGQQPAAGAERESTDKSVHGSKLDLTPDGLPTLLNLIRPQGAEWRHLKVEWLTDVVAARKRAAAEDKPIIICYTGGAGYNEPLGVC
jgi:hypothetical protein